MKRNKIIITILFLSFWGLNRMNAQEATDAAGGNASGAGGTVSYSVGQLVYTSVSDIGGTSNLGVQQPYEFVTVGINTDININLSYSVYPNPTTSSVLLNIGNQSLENLSYQLFDINGKLILNKNVTDVITIIPMESFATSNYLLKVNNEEKEIKSFRIIKNK